MAWWGWLIVLLCTNALSFWGGLLLMALFAAAGD